MRKITSGGQKARCWGERPTPDFFQNICKKSLKSLKDVTLLGHGVYDIELNAKGSDVFFFVDGEVIRDDMGIPYYF